MEIDGAATHGHEGDVLLAELLVDDLHHARQHQELRVHTKARGTGGKLRRQLSGGLAERGELPRESL